MSPSPLCAGAAPLNILNLGAVDFPGAHIETLESKLLVPRVKGVEAVCIALDIFEIAVSFVVISGDTVVLVPLSEVDLALLDELGADVVVLDVSAFKEWCVKMLGLNVTLADLEATALKSVVDLSVAAGLAWLEATVTGRELGCGLLKLRLCLFI